VLFQLVLAQPRSLGLEPLRRQPRGRRILLRARALLAQPLQLALCAGKLPLARGERGARGAQLQAQVGLLRVLFSVPL
jgi:hypothetical protein